MKSMEYAVIVAGGQGSRMKSDTPKQFLLLHGTPILMHTINAFFDYSPQIAVVLVLPEKDIPFWEKLCAKHGFNKPLTIVSGGASRFQSVKNGLDVIKGEGLVAIHDGVRPLVNNNIIGASFRLAALHNSAVAATRLKESIRITDQNTTKAMDRSLFRLVQTPQTFNLSLLKAAYDTKETSDLTDDASVMERAGHKISLFEGSYENIKVTTPEDLIIAESLMSSRTKGGKASNI